MNIFIKICLTILLFFQVSISISQEEILIPKRILGDPNAEITIEEYASMSCGHCANFHNETLTEIKKKYIDNGKAKLIFNDFPLDRTAMIGAMVSQCMNKGQFFPVINRLFQKQRDWV